MEEIEGKKEEGRRKKEETKTNILDERKRGKEREKIKI